ncbi:MAG: PadR family transcriptional regulator, partial [Pseudomonadota bacterium]
MDVKTLCLGVISVKPCSGYEIKKTIEDDFRSFFRASYGSIYPALAELERSGHVVGEAVEQEKRPDKKVYRITEAGLDALRASLADEEPRHVVRSEFLVLMCFAHLLTPERAAWVVDRMIAHFDGLMRTEVERWDEAAAELGPGERFALGYGRAVLTAALSYMQRER